MKTSTLYGEITVIINRVAQLPTGDVPGTRAAKQAFLQALYAARMDVLDSQGDTQSPQAVKNLLFAARWQLEVGARMLERLPESIRNQVDLQPLIEDLPVD